MRYGIRWDVYTAADDTIGQNAKISMHRIREYCREVNKAQTKLVKGKFEKNAITCRIERRNEDALAPTRHFVKNQFNFLSNGQYGDRSMDNTAITSEKA